MTAQLYSDEFYATRHENTVAAARIVLALVQSMLPPIRSAVDIGCGVGTWLAVLAENGCDVTGYEGNWVPAEHLHIASERIIRRDLSVMPIGSLRRFDLALSIECAEHLPPTAAGQLVGSLCKLSDFVLFSAAVPDQTGDGHINEQWPDYWAQLFGAHGYVCLDCIRPHIWQNEAIPWWYRQNALLFVRSERRTEIKPPPDAAGVPLPLVHPNLLKMWIDTARSQRESATMPFIGTLRRLKRLKQRVLG